MATTLTDDAIRRPFRLSFFFWIAAVMAFFIFSGFTLTYWRPMATGGLAPVPPVVHIHGAVFSSWMILLLIQSLLINVRHVPLHRALGTFGIVIATALLITGTIITLLFGDFNSTDSPSYYDLMYLSVVAMLGFGTLFTLAIRNTRRPEFHRRLILFATIPLLPPGINRLYQVALSLPDLPVMATYLTMDAIVAALLIYDWRTLNRISGASMIGVAIVLVPQVLHVPLAGSEAFAGFCRVLADLMYYR